MKEIQLSKEKIAIVDDEDYENLSQYSWHAKEIKTKNFSRWYAYRASKSRKQIAMHRAILGLESGNSLVVDHINHDGLDNRRENIRAVSQSLNIRNSRKSNCSSKLKGVYFNKKSQKWAATVHLGSFSNELEAANVQKSALQKLGIEDLTPPI